MKQKKILAFAGFMIVAMLLAVTLFSVSARPLKAIAPGLGQATSFAVLGASAVTNTGNSVVNGDLGIWPNALSSITGFPPGLVVPPGIIHGADGVTNAAQTNALNAFNNLEAQPCDIDLTGIDLGGLTLTPGVYCFDTSAQLTGMLTLNALGNPLSVWVFQIGSTMTTAPGSSVVFINGGTNPGCNLFWQVGSSATIDSTTAFQGNILADQSITMITNASLKGRAIALNAAVTLDTNTISPIYCPSNVSTATRPPLTQTAISTQLTGVIPNLTERALTPSPTLPIADQTALATQMTAVALTHAVVGQTLTAQAGTLAPTLTAISATQTAAAQPTATRTVRPRALPNTGFAQNRITNISAQPDEKIYSDLGSLWLEIPSLKVQSRIVGVPEINGDWDVSWLGNQTGWLNGSTFPTWAGNSVLTAHVYGYEGKPGPFVQLDNLSWGDLVIIHNAGSQYVYEVREVTQVLPESTTAMLKKESLPWLTLITCRGYDQASDTYKYRAVVRAVLIDTK